MIDTSIVEVYKCLVHVLYGWRAPGLVRNMPLAQIATKDAGDQRSETSHITRAMMPALMPNPTAVWPSRAQVNGVFMPV